jgi:hypothetical protein
MFIVGPMTLWSSSHGDHLRKTVIATDLDTSRDLCSTTLEPISKSIFDEEATLNQGINCEQHAESLEIMPFIDAVTLK